MRDPSGNEGDLISMSFAMDIATELEKEYLKVLAKQGYIAATKATDLVLQVNRSGNSWAE